MVRKKKLGAMLVEAGLLSEETLERGIKEHKKTSMKLGQFLVNRGMVEESRIVDLLSHQLGIEKYEPSKYPVDSKLSSILSSEVARRHAVVPLKQTKHLLTLGMLDPTDIHSFDTVEQLTGKEVEPVICTERELNQLTTTIYGISIDLGGILDSMGTIEYSEAEAAKAAPEEVRVDSLLDMAEGAPVVRMVNWIIAQAVRDGASDVHISPEKESVQLRYRIDGRLQEVPAPPHSMMLPIVSRVKILAHMDIAISMIPQDGRFTVKLENKEINIRASTVPTINGENVVLRLLDRGGTAYSLDHLGMRDSDRKIIESVIQRPYGMILSTGPTGSGKTTTLYAILRLLNQPDINIITVEDPVEYRIDKIRQLQLNTKAGMTFASGLRSILRQDPDVIMVGEIRDPETAQIAVQASLTGHRVLSTVHTNDAAGAITRLIDMGVEPFLVSSVLIVSFAQRLLRRVCPHCATPYTPTAKALEFWGLEEMGDVQFMKPGTCYNCAHTGYQGRVGIYEVLPIDDTIKELIAAKATTLDINRAARQIGNLRTLKQDAAEKLVQGITSQEEAMSVVSG